MGPKATTIKRIETAVDLLALARIPARLVRGVRLTADTRDAPIVPWLQVFDGQRWQPFDPATGETTIPEDYLLLWRGAESLAHLSGGAHLDVRISVRRSPQAGIVAAAAGGRLVSPGLLEFSPYMPLEE